jgi:hypothetical protein
MFKCMQANTVSLGLVALLSMAGCDDPLTEPMPTEPPSLAVAQAYTIRNCPTEADVVVSDEASLTAALLAAGPGKVIAIDGLIGISSDAVITSAGVTLTCASPGSGLYALPASTVNYLLRIVASGVTVDRLVLDAHGTGVGPFLSLRQQEVRMLHNMVTCGPQSCAFFIGGVRAEILDNYFEATGSATGVHLQAGVDGARVEGNAVVTTAPSGTVLFGGIRLLRGINVSVSHNVVVGPWQNSVALTNIRQSRVESNRVEGALRFGLTTEPRPQFPNTFFRDNTVRGNKMTGAGVAGILAVNACSNVFVGNNLGGNANDTGVLFSSTTGANTYIGNRIVVIDNGDFDCDGDAVADPNVITGASAILRGVARGPLVSAAVRPDERDATAGEPLF